MVSTLNIASWNVRGINLSNPANIVRRENLVNDSIRFNFDILCLQDTKCSEYEEFLLNGHKVELLEQSPGWTHYGLVFVISPALIPCVVAWKSISDRVAYIDLRLSGRNGKSMTMRIVSVYGPTIKRVTDSTNKVSGISKGTEAYYDNMKTATRVPARNDLFIAGDFNARLGSCSASDYDSGVGNNIGRYGNGTRNENGQMLLDFMVTHNLFACNTAFKKRAKDTTSWKPTCAAKGRPKGSKDTVEFYRQIDYILCRTSFKKCCFDAKSFPGDSVYSDHKPVVARFKLNCKYIVHKQHRPSQIRFDVKRLNDPEVKFNFANSFMSR